MIKHCGKQNSVNLLIYVVLRDSKLLELRSRIESEKESSVFQGSRVEFLFKIC